jgi:uncharacterized membrane protein YdjX (TVP38/TMEM64 family)
MGILSIVSGALSVVVNLIYGVFTAIPLICFNTFMSAAILFTLYKILTRQDAMKYQIDVLYAARNAQSGKCGRCGKMYATDSASCPHCGYRPS